MQLKNFDLQVPGQSIDSIWGVGWHGNYRLNNISRSEMLAPERSIEINCFLSVLADIDKSHVNLIELGAGWGEWGLALHGTVKRKLIDTHARSFNYLAIEGEPYYCELIEEHFEKNSMAGCVVYNCAVSDRNGSCYFDRFSGHQNFFDTWLTQGVTFGNVAGSKLKTFALAGYRILKGEVVKVPMYTLDTIVEMWGRQPDIIHMDVEGMEAKIIRVSTVKPEYWIIGTHHRKINDEIIKLLPDYRLVVNMVPGKKQGRLGQDGLQLFERMA
jgi:FkbM family methyltransferase